MSALVNFFSSDKHNSIKRYSVYNEDQRSFQIKFYLNKKLLKDVRTKSQPSYTKLQPERNRIHGAEALS